MYYRGRRRERVSRATTRAPQRRRAKTARMRAAEARRAQLSSRTSRHKAAARRPPPASRRRTRSSRLCQWPPSMPIVNAGSLEKKLRSLLRANTEARTNRGPFPLQRASSLCSHEDRQHEPSPRAASYSCTGVAIPSTNVVEETTAVSLLSIWKQKKHP